MGTFSLLRRNYTKAKDSVKSFFVRFCKILSPSLPKAGKFWAKIAASFKEIPIHQNPIHLCGEMRIFLSETFPIRPTSALIWAVSFAQIGR